MRHTWNLLAVLGLGLAGPALAQQAPAAAPAPAARPAAAPAAAPAATPAAAPAAAAAPAVAPRPVAPRDLMTPAERAAFRAQMEQSTVEQRRVLWAQKHQELAQRATASGQTMAQPVRGLGAADGAMRREAAGPKAAERPARWSFWGLFRR